MTDAATVSSRPYHDLDISDDAFWDKSFHERDETFARLRAEPGLTWHKPAESVFPHSEQGFWAATRHEDIRYISNHPELFCSGNGVTMDPMPAEIQRGTTFFLTMDPPEHTRYRRLISMAFTPKQVRKIEEQIRANAAGIVDDYLAALDSGEPLDFMDTVAKRLPMKTISEMIGLAPEHHEAVAAAAEALFSGSDEEYASFDERAIHMMTQLGVLQQSGIELAKQRRVEPKDDLMTNIVNAEIDGQGLTDDEIGALMVLLASAGNDTTKQTVAHTYKALMDNPEQLAWLREDFDGRFSEAVDEFVRWSSPVMTFARHAVTDTEVAGTPIRAGEKIVLFYCSGNFDENVFDEPRTFDLSRSPNPHVGFGGGGPHFCLGKQLAVMELKHLMGELVMRSPDVALGTPEYVHSDFVHGIKRMSVTKA